MSVQDQVLSDPRGWLRSPAFDLGFIVGVAALALGAGVVSVARPELFPLLLLLDLWFLGYHHVVATFTRLSFDRESFREHRFLVLWLPWLVLAAALGLVLSLGGWVLSTTYLYWQWFHYTRQSYGIERVYRRKAGGSVPGEDRLTRWALYLVPLWGILYRSYQAPATFLGVELKVLPVPRELVYATGAVTAVVVTLWLGQVIRAWVGGAPLQAHTLYLVSHMVVFAVGYVVIEDINYGWLVINAWHNAQYILFVWMYNTNRFRTGVDPQHRFLSTLSQWRNWPLYLVTCLGISTVAYYGVDHIVGLLAASSTLPLLLVAYQTINFHHYIVDGLIWKVRKKPLRQNLGLA